MNVRNLLTDLPANGSPEMFETLLGAEQMRVERIVSQGHASSNNDWYDQPQHEWVVVLEGAARLEFEESTVMLNRGDCLNIPAHKRHRVAWTEPERPTIWLAIHYG